MRIPPLVPYLTSLTVIGAAVYANPGIPRILGRPVIAGASAAPIHPPAAARTAPPQGLDALDAITGVWQSDTVDGVSARSQCAWTPGHLAVVCDQAIRTPSGDRADLNLFTFAAATGKYALYHLSPRGGPMQPVPLAIQGHIWTYGGDAPSQDGKWYRTINDFTAGTTYTWRAESSSDGTTWTVGAHGSSRRVR